MTDRLGIAQVPVALRARLRGDYNALVSACRSCGVSYDHGGLNEYRTPVLVGFADWKGEVVAMKECQQCFAVGFHHVRTADFLETILRLITRGKPNTRSTS